MFLKPTSRRFAICSHLSVLPELCREARRRDGADWGVDPTVPAYSSPVLFTGNGLAEAHCLLAAFALRDGDCAQAVEAIRGVVHLSWAVGEWPGLGFLLRSSIGSFTWYPSRKLVPLLTVGLQTPAVTPEVVRTLIKELLTASQHQDLFVRDMMCERSQLNGFAEQVRDGKLSLGEPEYGSGRTRRFFRKTKETLLLRPLWVHEAAGNLRLMSAYVDAARQTSYPAAMERIPSLEDTARLDRFTLLAPALHDIYKFQFQWVAKARIIAIAFSVRLYELEHGRRPGKLEELVPKYLPAVPADPFARDGAAIRYAPDANPPVLYSVYLDGKDDGGIALESDGRVDERKSPDLVFFLNGDRPAGKRN